MLFGFEYSRPGDDCKIDIGVFPCLATGNGTKKDECNHVVIGAEFFHYLFYRLILGNDFWWQIQILALSDIRGTSI